MREARHSRYGNAILALVSMVLGVVFLEYVVAPFILYRGVERDLALMGFYVWPNTVVDDTIINNQGYTGHELSDEEEFGLSMHVLTLGGSTMFNRRMTDRMIDSWAKTIPFPTKVVGAALRTHTTRASVIKYDYHFSKYHFDYVLIYHGINDLWANNIQPENFSSDYSHQNPWGRRSTILDSSILARITYNHLYPGTGAFPGNAANAAMYLAEESFESNLRRLVSSIRSHDGVPVLMTFAWHIPNEYTFDAFQRGDLGYNNPTRYDYCPVELWGDVTYVVSGLQRLNSIIREISREMKVDLIDQHSRLSDNLENFGDPVHFSEIGTERFINSITLYFDSKRVSQQVQRNAASSTANYNPIYVGNID